MKCILLIIFYLPLSAANQEEPGVKGRLTSKGLQYGLQVGLEELQSRLSSFQIPDVRGSISVAILGTIYYSVTSLQIENLDVSDSNLSFISDTGVNMEISDGQLSITGYLQIATWLFSASTNLEVVVSGLSLTGIVGVTGDDTGHGKVWDGGCNSDVNNVEINFHGGSGWFLSMFKSSIIGPVYDALTKQLCPQFEKALEQMEQTLSSLPVVSIVDSVASLEYPLVDLPLITEQSLDVFVKGQFIGRSQRWDPPDHPEKLVLPDIDSHMVLLALSQFSVHSAGYVHYMSGILNYNITDDVIPKQSPLRLNTKSLSTFVPEILTRFPDSPPLLLHISAHSPPAVNIQPDILTVDASADIHLYAMAANHSLVPIFQMRAGVETQVDIQLSEESLGVALSLRNFSLALIHSDAGPVKVDNLKNILNFALKLVALPLMNKKLQNMVTIPTHPVRLQNPELRILKGYLVVVTDFELSLSPPLQQAEKVTEPQ
ncbi:bactericidal permeability-increasing protein-like [Pelobates fuscus]|uniref:bactericidal permeability-increasing protein-like n=1 Tax=Pelobates fuscus TaxID=191477 RepID=UPI002FE45B8F